MRQQRLTTAGCLFLAAVMVAGFSALAAPAKPASHAHGTAAATATAPCHDAAAKDAASGTAACPMNAEGGTCCAAREQATAQAKPDDGCPCPTCTPNASGQCKGFVDADRNGACDDCVTGLCATKKQAQKKSAETAAPSCPMHTK